MAEQWQSYSYCVLRCADCSGKGRALSRQREQNIKMSCGHVVAVSRKCSITRRRAARKAQGRMTEHDTKKPKSECGE